MAKENYFVRLVKLYKVSQSLDTLAEKLGCPVSKVRKDIERLQDAGLKIRMLGRRKKAVAKEENNGPEIANVQTLLVAIAARPVVDSGNGNGNVVVEQAEDNRVAFGPYIPEYEMLKWRANYTVFGMVSHYGEGSGI